MQLWVSVRDLNAVSGISSIFDTIFRYLVFLAVWGSPNAPLLQRNYSTVLNIMAPDLAKIMARISGYRYPHSPPSCRLNNSTQIKLWKDTLFLRFNDSSTSAPPDHSRDLCFNSRTQLIAVHRTYTLTSSGIRIPVYIGVLTLHESALKSGQRATIATMASVRAAVDVVGLDPISTTVKCTNKVSPSKALAQVPTPFIIVLYNSLIHHISFAIRELCMLITITCGQLRGNTIAKLRS